LHARLHLSDRRARYGGLFDGDGWRTGHEGKEDLAGPSHAWSGWWPIRGHLLRELRPHRPATLSG